MKKGPSRVVICIATANIMHPIDSNSERNRSYWAFFNKTKKTFILKGYTIIFWNAAKNWQISTIIKAILSPKFEDGSPSEGWLAPCSYTLFKFRKSSKGK